MQCDTCARSAEHAVELAASEDARAVRREFAKVASSKTYRKRMSDRHRQSERCGAPDLWLRCHVTGEQAPS